MLTGKTERMEFYNDRNTQALLGKFLGGEVNKLEPVFDPKVGYRYPLVEAIVGDAVKAEMFLNRLSDVGILEKKLYDKMLVCPKCNSVSVAVHYCCPYCKSFDVQKSSLIEHVKCGYMDVEENFRKGGKLVCQKCHEELKKLDVDYRRAGIWCSCMSCGKSFDVPVATLFCRDCRSDFTFEEVVIKNVYSYRMRDEVREEAQLGWILVAPIKEFLTICGFDVDGPAFLKGKSGANHMFDIVAHKKGDAKKVTVIDVATLAEGTVAEQSVIALFAKVFDVSPDSAYLIAIPKMSDNGKKMAELYNIQIIEAKNQKEATKALKERMTKTK
jgi:hypothetical protein